MARPGRARAPATLTVRTPARPRPVASCAVGCTGRATAGRYRRAMRRIVALAVLAVAAVAVLDARDVVRLRPDDVTAAPTQVGEPVAGSSGLLGLVDSVGDALGRQVGELTDRVGEEVTRARDGVAGAGEQLARSGERTRFCLEVPRTLGAIEAGEPTTALAAVDELVALAPDELREDARVIADAMRAADAAGSDPAWALADPDLRDRAQRLDEATRAYCSPFGG